MKKVLKILFVCAGLLILVLVGAVQFWLGSTLKQRAQDIGSKALGSPLRIETLTINPFKGTLRLSGLRLASLPAFNHTNTISAAGLEIKLKMGSLFSDTLVIQNIRAEKPQFTLELNPQADNIAAYIQNVRQYTGKKKKPASSQKKGKAFLIQSLELSDGRITVAHTDEPLLNLSLDIAKASAGMDNGRLRLSGLRLGNARRKLSTNLFSVEELNIHLEPKALTSARFHILDAQFIKPQGYMLRESNTQGIKGFAELINYFVDLRKNWKKNHAEELATRPPVPPARRRFQLHDVTISDPGINLLDYSTNSAAAPHGLAAADKITLKRMEGHVQAEGLRIVNPVGFYDTNCLELAALTLEIQPETLFSRHLVVKTLKADSPLFHFERNMATGNLTKWKTIIHGFIPPPPPPVIPASQNTYGPPPKKHVSVESVQITNCIVTLSIPKDFEGLSVMAKGRNAIGKAISHGNPLHKYKGSFYVPANPNAFTLMTFADLTSDIPKGTTEVHDIYVGNLRGYSSPKLAHLNLLKTQLVPTSRASTTLRFSEILFERPEVLYERSIRTDNIKAFNTALRKVLELNEQEKSTSTDQMPPSSPGEPTSQGGQKVIIDRLHVQHGTVRAKISALPTAPIPIPTLTMKDIGAAEGGVSSYKMLSILGDTFYKSITSAATGATGLIGNTVKDIASLPIEAWDLVTGKGEKKEGAETKEEADKK